MAPDRDVTRGSSDENDTVTLNEGTRLDLRTVIIVVGGILSVAGAMARGELAMTKMDADLRATIEAVRVEAREANRDQDTKTAEDRNTIANIQATTCAIARKMDVPSVGCR